MSAQDESSWQLLFSIALSHGEALHTRQLSWDGWLVFLSSAQLIGTATGVFPVLLDQLWQRQALRVAPTRREGDERGKGSTSSLSDASSRVYFSDTTNDAQHYGEVVEFGGFTDMMKVLCVRVYQSFQLTNLRKTHDDHGDAVLVALRRCAEDRVLLTEAVRFTASRYLRPFIAKSTIQSTSRVSLRASLNGWALHVNRLITHIVGALNQSTIVPIYHAYADAATGRLTERGFRAFLREYLPGLNTVEETCALAIFAHGGFPDIRPLLKPLLPLAATSSAVSLLTSVPTLGLTDFVEMLLMLAVVVFADEERHPGLKPITAKVWVFFDRYLCNGVKSSGGTSMCVDPYVCGRYTAVSPGLISVFPAVVPLLPSPMLFVEVCNATCQARSVTNTELLPSTRSMHQQQLQLSSITHSTTSPMDEKTPFITEVPVTDAESSTLRPPASASPSSAVREREEFKYLAPSLNNKTAVEMASPFFASRWSLLERNACVPLFGDDVGASTVCQVSVGGTVVEAIPALPSCPEIWQLDLSALALSSMKLTRCAVVAVPVYDNSLSPGSSYEAGGDTGDGAVAAADSDGAPIHNPAVRLIFTPIRTFPVELVLSESGEHSDRTACHAEKTTGSGPQRRGSNEELAHLISPWGCKDVVLTDTSVTQLVAPLLVQRLAAFFDSVAEASDASAAIDSSNVPAAPASVSPVQHATFSVAALSNVCRRLQWCAASKQDGRGSFEPLCKRALTTCRLYQRMLNLSGPQCEGVAAPPSTEMSKEMSIAEVLGCLSLLLLLDGDASVLRDVPDVPRRLELALQAASATKSNAESSIPPMTSANLRSLPHNKLRDEPFKLALEKKEAQSVASHERRAALMKSLQEHHKQQLTCPVALPLLPESRPNATRLVSQYGNCDPAANFQRVMREGAETIKAYFIEKELAIPEWQGN